MSVELLTDLVRRYSPSTEESPAVHYLVEWMNHNGISAYVDEVGNACGIRENVNAIQTLILLGHIDTVPGEIPVQVEENRLYGRGSVDAKGSLCAFAAAAALAEIPANWRVVVVGAVEEESATSRGARFIRERFIPDLCVIGEPSGAERITLGYKGRLLLDYTLSRPVGHTARPEPTVGALGTDFWQKTSAWAEAENAGIERFFDQIMPSLRSINTSTDHFFDTLQMTLGFRLPPRISPQDVLEAVRAFAPADGTFHAYSLEHAYQGDRNNILVRGMMAAIRAGGSQPGFVLKTGTSDMNVVGEIWKCPIVAYGPGDSNLDHTPEEHLPLDEYARAIQTLRYFIEHLPSAT